jgi:phospholipid/cholesterol/gamma-HCH transport system ATP-binding protein
MSHPATAVTGTALLALDAAVRIRGLTFRRGEKVIFSDMDVTIPKGKVTAVMGPSGCGKTTLLGVIGGSVRPESGQVQVLGQDLRRLSRSGLMRVRRSIGMLFQSGALFTDLSVFDNVAFPLREHTKLPEELIRDLVLMKLEAVGLRGAQAMMPAQLSGGMGRRVALARAIALDPSIMLYDEPFTGQDPISMGVLLRLIRLLNDTLGLTSVVVSHDIHETAGIADYIYLLDRGHVAAQGTPDELRNGSAWARQFMNAEPDGPVPFHYGGPSIESDLLAGPAA